MKTGNRPASPRCTLGQSIAEPMDTDKIKREGWREHRILVVQADHPRLTWMEQQVIEIIGKKLYG